ncbi:MAG: hypothetical protein CSA34_04590 [Desulfobulbus propionicus]|nr:MAG: hypothetical protein CSA34_04590 [Desulfobulbus propionicus]
MIWLDTVMPFFKVFAAFALMLFFIRIKVPLWLAILGGALGMGLFFGLAPSLLVQTGASALVQPKFLVLVSIVGLILMLSGALEKTGQSARLMEALGGYLVRPRLRLVFFPALIGLLPMPGGAVFSAPMVKSVSQDLEMTNEDRVLINYWFRHIWEFVWPLYPGFILTVSLAEIPVANFIAHTWPGVPVMFFLGWWFFLRKTALTVRQGTQTAQRKGSGLDILLAGLPLIIAICGAIGLEFVLSHAVTTIPMEMGVIVALAAAVACVMVQNRLGGDFLWHALTGKGLWSMLAVIGAIFIFKDIMATAGVVESMAAAAGGATALLAASILLPFLVGLISGINVAFVGATFPLILGLLHTLGMEDKVLAYMVLGTFSGFTGVMVSPLHICFLLTTNYFDTELPRTWRRLVVPCAGIALTGFILFALLA